MPEFVNIVEKSASENAKSLKQVHDEIIELIERRKVDTIACMDREYILYSALILYSYTQTVARR